MHVCKAKSAGLESSVNKEIHMEKLVNLKDKKYSPLEVKS
jgi:hypothetical protein